MDSRNQKARILNKCLQTYKINEIKSLQINKSYKISAFIAFPSTNKLKTQLKTQFKIELKTQLKTQLIWIRLQLKVSSGLPA